MIELDGYRSERKSSRLYGGKDRYTWVKVTDPQGGVHHNFDPWLGSSLPQHYLLQCLSRIARQQGRTHLARACLERALKQARQERDKTHYRYLLTIVDTPSAETQHEPTHAA